MNNNRFSATTQCIQVVAVSTRSWMDPFTHYYRTPCNISLLQWAAEPESISILINEQILHTKKKFPPNSSLSKFNRRKFHLLSCKTILSNRSYTHTQWKKASPMSSQPIVQLILIQKKTFSLWCSSCFGRVPHAISTLMLNMKYTICHRLINLCRGWTKYNEKTGQLNRPCRRTA